MESEAAWGSPSCSPESSNHSRRTLRRRRHGSCLKTKPMIFALHLHPTAGGLRADRATLRPLLVASRFPAFHIGDVKQAVPARRSATESPAMATDQRFVLDAPKLLEVRGVSQRPRRRCHHQREMAGDLEMVSLSGVLHQLWHKASANRNKPKADCHACERCTEDSGRGCSARLAG
jgi:hypothetical protein